MSAAQPGSVDTTRDALGGFVLFGEGLGRLCLQPCMENKPQKLPHLHPGSPSPGFHAWLEFTTAKSQELGQSIHPCRQSWRGRGRRLRPAPAPDHGSGPDTHPSPRREHSWSRSQTHERCLRPSRARRALPEPHRDSLFCQGLRGQSTARPCTLHRSSSPFFPQPTSGGAARSGRPADPPAGSQDTHGSHRAFSGQRWPGTPVCWGHLSSPGPQSPVKAPAGFPSMEQMAQRGKAAQASPPPSQASLTGAFHPWGVLR